MSRVLFIIPLVLLDLFAALYQVVCFPVYGIPRVRRAEYMAFDRGQLTYLNALEKINRQINAEFSSEHPNLFHFIETIRRFSNTKVRNLIEKRRQN